MPHHIKLTNKSSFFLIANPTSGNGKFSKKWAKIQYLLKAREIDYSFAFTAYSKHEIKLVDEAIQKGFRKIISVGGDGTLHHVVNAIMLQTYVKSLELTIGVIPLGTGNDWIKTYQIPNNIEKAIDIIQQNKTISQDIGCIKTTDHQIHYFNNVAGLGYDGYVVHKLNSLKRFGAISYLLAGIYGLLFYKKSIFKIYFNNKIIKTNCLMTIIGICQFSGGGMQFTKDVNPKNGLLDITIAKNLNLLDLFLNLPKLYNGKIVYHKKIETHQTKNIKIIPVNSKPFIQSDGELLGTGSITVSIQKNAIKFYIK